MTYGSHLRRSRHGILYFRIVIPLDLRASIGTSEIAISLGTSSRRTANVISLRLQVETDRFLTGARRAISMNDSSEAFKAMALRALIERTRAAALLKERQEADEQIQALNSEIKALTNTVVSLTSSMPTRAVNAQAHVEVNTPSLAGAIEAFKAEKKAKSSWTTKTSEKWDANFKWLIEWFGDIPVCCIDRNMMVGFLEAIKLIPKNAHKYTELRDLPMKALINVSASTPRISSTTVSQLITSISGFFAWMENDRTKWQVTSNVARDLRPTDRKGKGSVVRVAFSDSDLRAMFNQPEWLAREFLHSYSYWLLPLGLYTGARINELCQLALRDFEVINGQPVVHLCNNLPGKTPNAKRTVPLHSELIRLGLLRYVEKLKQRGMERLFPECTPKRDGHGQDASKWFGKFKLRAGISDKAKVFHSFRHGFSNQLLNAGLDPITRVGPLMGHAGKGQSAKSYWNERDALSFVKAVEILNYPAASELIPAVEAITFGIDVHRRNRRPPKRLPRLSPTARPVVRK